MKARYSSRTLNKESIHNQQEGEPWAISTVFFFFFCPLCKTDYTKAASDCSMGETICVTPPICIFSPYFQPITVLLSVMLSIINNLAFILTHVCKAQLSTVCSWKGMAMTSYFICRTNWEHSMQQFFIPWWTFLRNSKPL